VLCCICDVTASGRLLEAGYSLIPPHTLIIAYLLAYVALNINHGLGSIESRLVSAEPQITSLWRCGVTGVQANG
jgi:hypothetical protein